VRGLRVMKRRKKQFPVKTTVNLLRRKRTESSLVKTFLAVLVFAVVLTVFAKFAVIDRLAAASRALREAEELEQTVLELQLKNADYDDVLREYQHYYFSAADRNDESGGNWNYVNCMEVLGLLDEELLNKAGIQTVNLSGNVLTVDLTKINLEKASEIARSLSENELVDQVMVASANRQDELEGTTVYMNIILKTETNDEAGEDE